MSQNTPDTTPPTYKTSPAAEITSVPVSRGFALALVLLNVAVLGGMGLYQQHRMNVLLSEVRAASSSASPADPAFTQPLADPEMCWLLGVLANGQGKGDVVAGMGHGATVMSDCQTYAMRGARGQGMSGN